MDDINQTIQELEKQISALTLAQQEQFEALNQQIQKTTDSLNKLETELSSLTNLVANDPRLVKHTNGVTIMLNLDLTDAEKQALVGQKLRFEFDKYTVGG